VRVTVQTPLRIAVRSLVASEIPDDERLVPGSGQEHVWASRQSVCAQLAHDVASIFRMQSSRCGSKNFIDVLLEGGSQGGDPAAVALKGATENQLLGHDCVEWLKLGD
jgi:hypothetical protein